MKMWVLNYPLLNLCIVFEVVQIQRTSVCFKMVTAGQGREYPIESLNYGEAQARHVDKQSL